MGKLPLALSWFTATATTGASQERVMLPLNPSATELLKNWTREPRGFSSRSSWPAAVPSSFRKSSVQSISSSPMF